MFTSTSTPTVVPVSCAALRCCSSPSSESTATLMSMPLFARIATRAHLSIADHLVRDEDVVAEARRDLRLADRRAGQPDARARRELAPRDLRRLVRLEVRPQLASGLRQRSRPCGGCSAPSWGRRGSGRAWGCRAMVRGGVMLSVIKPSQVFGSSFILAPIPISGTRCSLRTSESENAERCRFLYGIEDSLG